jgi:hypothetical protein
VFDKVEDEEKRESIKTMVGSLFDCMQDCEDYIETVERNNSLPFYHKGRDKRFAARASPVVAWLPYNSSGGLHHTVKEYHTRGADLEAQRPMELHVEWIHQDSDFVVHVG